MKNTNEVYKEDSSYLANASALHNSIERHVAPHIKTWNKGNKGSLEIDSFRDKIDDVKHKIAKATSHPIKLVSKLVNDHVRSKFDDYNESVELEESRMAELHDSIERHVEPHIRAYKKGKIDADTLGHRIVLAHDKVAKDTGHPVELVRRLVNDHADDRLSESTELEEAARGTMHRVEFKYDTYEKDGSRSTSTGITKLYAPSKEHAKRYATDDLAHKYVGFRAVRATEIKPRNEEIEMKPTRRVILEAIARVKDKMINEEIVYEDEVVESLKGSPWDPKAEPLSHYLPSKPKATRTGDAGEKITSVKGSYGKDDDDEDEDGNKKPKFEPPVKRGRGRPAGSKSGARTHGEDGGVKNQAIYGGHEHSMLTPSASRFSK